MCQMFQEFSCQEPVNLAVLNMSSMFSGCVQLMDIGCTLEVASGCQTHGMFLNCPLKDLYLDQVH